MNILLIGGGGREHALAWKLRQSPSCDTLYAAPGNPGIAEEARLVALDVADHAAVLAFCKERRVKLVVVGPEQPLVDGLADRLRSGGFPVFGPGAAAARLEGSKGFTKDLCKAAGIPTAPYGRFDSRSEALKELHGFGLPVVIKADGLAAGKGVVIADTLEVARAAIDDMFGGGFGTAGAEVVIEAFLEGEEASLFALTDGVTVLPFGSAQDHKRVGDGDRGPNTGGMGAYSPARVLTPALQEQAMREIVEPTVRALTEADTPYVGVLYAGLMLTESGPQLIEYNCRFGDPECQVLMTRFDGDLAALMLACAQGKLAEAEPPRFSDEVALTVVMAAKGYPGMPDKGGLVAVADTGEVKVFHAGTALADGRLIANGGRVLNVTAAAPSVREARERAYAAIGAIDFPSGFYRKDIGWREEARERGG